MSSQEHFCLYVRDALGHLNDPGHLRTNPLSELLYVSGSTDGSPAIALRRVLQEAIEALRPSSSVPSSNPAWLSYDILERHYLRDQSPVSICGTLGLSRTSFYRQERQATEAVACFLWDAYRQKRAATVPMFAAPPSGDESPIAPADQGEAEAVRLAHESPREAVNPRAVLDSARQLLEPLLQEYGVSLTLVAPAALPCILGDPAILRQIVLSVLAEGVRFAQRVALKLTVEATEEGTLWRLSCVDPHTRLDARCAQTPALALCRRLLEVYGGRLQLEADAVGLKEVCLQMPTLVSHRLLVIDDSEDALALYQRYLQAENCIVDTASSVTEVEARLAGTLYDLILLDVIMPRQDGWDILQRLKTLPETAGIPVVVCSVLSQPHLALSLGAEEVLHKPVSEESLLACVRRVLARRAESVSASAATRAGSVPNLPG